MSLFPLDTLSTRYLSQWQGRGAFGSVVKARNKIDSRVYAGTVISTDSYIVTLLTPSPVKKVRLRTPNTDNKILREINALSRLSHRFIVRYYTAWFEDSELASATMSSDDSGDDTADGATSVLSGIIRRESRDGSSDPFGIDLDDLGSESRSSTSFPSIHFTGSGSGGTEGSDGDIDGDETEADELGEMFEAPRNGSAVINVVPRTPPAPRPRTLYIQMVSFFTSTRI
jgi:translation initiation factor 2-alpha kinase 4